MTTTTPSLADWLLSCIAEDEAGETAWVWMPHMDGSGDYVRGATIPATPRTLAEVEAKRRIVDYWRGASRDVECGYDWPVGQLHDGRLSLIEAVLRALALPYADRDGYREEWRP